MASPARKDFPFLTYLDNLVDDLRRLIRPAIDASESDAIHHARVSTRRLKASLDLLQPIVPEDCRKPMAKVLRNLRRRLGSLRDLDVMIKHVEELRGAKRHAEAQRWLSERLLSERDKLRKKTRRKLSPDRLAGKLDAWLPIREQVIECRESISSLLAQSLHLQLDAFAEQADRMAAGHQLDAVHPLRLAGKNLRYTLEMAHEHGHDLPKSIFKSFKRMQDALGLWHDFVVLAEQAMRESLDDELAQSDAATQEQALELARSFLRKSTAKLNQFRELWKQQGSGIAEAIRTSFPLTRGLSESKTDHDPAGSDGTPAPEPVAPDAISNA